MASKPVILMGHSYGGLLAIKYAADHPEGVQGLVLVNSMPSFSHSKQSMKKKMVILTMPDAIFNVNSLWKSILNR